MGGLSVRMASAISLPDVAAKSSWPEWFCPLHQSVLLQSSDRLLCPGDHAYPIVNHIPRFVSGSNYTGHFGAQWTKYRVTQLDSYTGTTITRDRASRCLGEALWNDLAGKHVLECGCGAGRFTEILLERGARVTSIDASRAVDANVANFPLSDAHRVAHADIMHLPFVDQEYDVVFCLGVIQHTPRPAETIAALYRHVRPEGVLVLDHYTYEAGWYTKTAPLFRMWLKRLSEERAMAVIERLVDTLLPLHRWASRNRLARSVVSRLSPVLTYYVTYPALSPTLQREWALLDTHDSLTDWYKHFRTRRQIHSLLDRLGMEEIWCAYGGNGVEARGRRPRP